MAQRSATIMQNWPVHLALDHVSGEAGKTGVTGFPLLPPFCCFSTAVDSESETTEWNPGVRRVEARDSEGKIDLGNGEVEAGGPQFLLFVGASW